MNHSTGDDPAGNPEPIGEILKRHPFLKPTKPQQFALLLQDTPGHTIPAITRLKSVLKLLGRGYHLRCVSAVDVTGKAVPE